MSTLVRKQFKHKGKLWTVEAQGWNGICIAGSGTGKGRWMGHFDSCGIAHICFDPRRRSSLEVALLVND